MPWQDIVISIVVIVFSVSLIPQVYTGFKHKTGAIRLLTSVPTTTGLYVLSFTYWTLHLYFAASLNFTTATLWLMFVIQRLVYKKD